MSTIPLALHLAYVPHFLKFGLMLANKNVNYNNENPRSEDLSQYRFMPELMQRAKAAHLNSLEMFPFFAVSVLLARIQKVKPEVLTPLCAKYLLLRALYVLLYILGVNKVVALLRTLTWGSMLSLVTKIAFAGL